jgi:branched-chain amino acid transport system permease protein
MMNTRTLHITALLFAVLLAIVPFITSDFYAQLITRMMIFAIFAMSLDLLIGVTGLVSLGHAGFFGLAGYSLALLTPESGPVSLWWSLPAVLLVNALTALVIGALVVRTKGIYFIMVTLAFSQMLFFIFHDNKFAGGSDGKYVYFKPSAALFGFTPFDLENKLTFYFFVWVILVIVFIGLRRLMLSSFAHSLQGIRVNEHRMRALGYGVTRYKLAAFTLAGTLAGLAGYLWGAQSGFVNPELLGFHLSAQTIMMVILGGMGNFLGAAIGAFAFEGITFVFKDISKHWQLLMGGLIVLLVMFAPKGILGALSSLFKNKEAKHE